MIPVLITLPFAVFGMVFQLSFITVGKAGFGAALSVMGGVLNIVLDWLFIAIFHWGLAGGAVVDFFAKNNAQVETIALYGFRIVATSFLMMACNVFASGWFTALNDVLCCATQDLITLIWFFHQFHYFIQQHCCCTSSTLRVNLSIFIRFRCSSNIKMYPRFFLNEFT